MTEVIPALDLPSSSPGLDFDKTACALESAIINAKRGRLTIGVFGPYGSGKTTLMDAIERKIIERKDESLQTVRFSAWRYDHEDYLFLPLISAIRRNPKIRTNPSLRDRFDAARQAFIRGPTLEVNLGLGKIALSGDKYRESEDKLLSDPLKKVSAEYIDVYHELSQVLLADDSSLRFRIVVFVDDLDRCYPKKAFRLLEQLKSLMDMEGYIFVVGLDPRSIARSLKQKHEESSLVSLDEYIEKMFQVQYSLTSPIDTEIHGPIDCILDDLGSRGADTTWLEEIKKARNFLDSYWPTNLRKIKRILNIHQILIHEHESVNAEVLIGLLVLRDCWPPVWNVLKFFGRNAVEMLQSNPQDSQRRPDGEQAKVLGYLGHFGGSEMLKDKKLTELFINQILPKADHDIDKVLLYISWLGAWLDIRHNEIGGERDD